METVQNYDTDNLEQQQQQECFRSVDLAVFSDLNRRIEKLEKENKFLSQLVRNFVPQTLNCHMCGWEHETKRMEICYICSMTNTQPFRSTFVMTSGGCDSRCISCRKPTCSKHLEMNDNPRWVCYVCNEKDHVLSCERERDADNSHERSEKKFNGVVKRLETIYSLIKKMKKETTDENVCMIDE